MAQGFAGSRARFALVIGAALFCLAAARYGLERRRRPSADLKGARQTADITVRISEGAVQRFAEAAFPIHLRGKETVKVSAPLVGTVGMQVPWTAVARDPQIRIRKGEGTFTAKVTVTSSGMKCKDTISGKLKAEWSPRRKAIVVKVTEARLNLRLRRGGQVLSAGAVDVSDRVPTFVLPVQFSDPVVRVGKKRIRMRTRPRVALEEGAVVVESDLTFRKSGR